MKYILSAITLFLLILFCYSSVSAQNQANLQSKVEPKDSEEEASFDYQTRIRTENYGRNN